MIKVDLSDLLSRYDENLLDNLRGFGNQIEFLKFWVPGTNSLKSFYNLIDALYESNNYIFIVQFQKGLLDSNSLDKLKNFLNEISLSKYNLSEKKIEIEIKIDRKFYENFRKNNYLIKNFKEGNIILDKKKKIEKFESQNNLEKLYIDNLKKIKSNNYFSEKILQKKNIFVRELGKYRLFFLIENKIVKNLFHDGNDNNELIKLINVFFDICLNKSIQEVADHSVIYLEEKIRIVSDNLIKKGIILPSHGGKYFDLLNEIVRDIFKQYKDENSFEFKINKNYFKKSYEWINLSETEKNTKVESVLKQIRLANFLNDESLVVQSIESNFRVNLAINEDFRMLQSKKNILLQTEIKLKELDNTLEVFIDEVLDKNKLRLKNSPQTKLLN